ncbi:hypothetical protein Q7F20_09285 [Curtobacterium sp. A7_M15]|nr:hypothetical protein [Curtobacterium sp. A7_M15]MDP4333564.1 hypothetical protein [Curtobacterium sp. A7_M15]
MFQRILNALTPGHIRLERAEAHAWQTLAEVIAERQQMARKAGQHR